MTRRPPLPLGSLALLFAAAALLPSTAADADRLEATLGQPLREVAHAVDVRLRGGTAVYTVRRSFANSGQRHDEASLRIELPFGAAATGLRIRSRRRWYDGELLPAEQAARMYQELTGFGPHTPRDPALLQWVWCDEVHLQVFPVPPGGVATVEYTLTAPTRYAGGRHVLFYPRQGEQPALAAPVLRVFPEAFSGPVAVDGQLEAPTQPLVLTRVEPPAWLAGHPIDPAASYAFSELEVGPTGRKVDQITVALDLRHTFRGDLKVALVAPWGAWHTLHDRQGGGDNDLRGRFEVKLGAARAPAGRWRLVASDHARLDSGSIDRFALSVGAGKQQRSFVARDTPRVVPDAPQDGAGAGVAAIEVAPGPIDTVAARLGRVVAAADKSFLRLEVDTAPQLRPLPEAPEVVFVIDASHSMGERGIAAQLALARAFGAHVPDARVQLVAFSRRAREVLPGFVAPAALDAALAAAAERGVLAPQNGSALELGVQRAVALLGGRRPASAGAAGARPPSPPRRPAFVVMLTDALLRPAWRNRLALAPLRRLRGARVRTAAHVVLPELDSGEEVSDTRDDRHLLAPLAQAGGGVLLKVAGFPLRDNKALERVALGLVRPVRIDGFRVDGLAPSALPELPDRLAEGEGIREMVKLPRSPRLLLLRGKIWARDFRRVLRASAGASRDAAAYVFSLDLHQELTPAQMLRVAQLGRAVSPVTSYLAIEPGVRPSTAGIVRTVGHGAGRGSGAGYGAGGGRLGARRPGLESLLGAAVARCTAAHPPSGPWSVKLIVHTTRDEVVDVQLDSPRTPLALCLVEETWALRLPGAYHRFERDSQHVVLP